MSVRFWPFAVLNANEEWNSTPKQNKNWESLCEGMRIQDDKWFNKHSIGAKVMGVNNFTTKLRKLEDRAFEAIYLSRVPNCYGNYIWDVEYSKIR